MTFLARRFLLALSLLLALVACDPLISRFSDEAYRNATSLKARSLALIGQSGAPFATEADAVAQLLVDVDAAYEFVKGRPGNEISAAQWDLMRNPEGALLGGYMALWQRSGRVSPLAREDAGEVISAGFDRIICLEINKREPRACDDLEER